MCRRVSSLVHTMLWLVEFVRTQRRSVRCLDGGVMLWTSRAQRYGIQSVLLLDPSLTTLSFLLSTLNSTIYRYPSSRQVPNEYYSTLSKTVRTWLPSGYLLKTSKSRMSQEGPHTTSSIHNGILSHNASQIMGRPDASDHSERHGGRHHGKDGRRRCSARITTKVRRVV